MRKLTILMLIYNGVDLKALLDADEIMWKESSIDNMTEIMEKEDLIVKNGDIEWVFDLTERGKQALEAARMAILQY